jgi:serine/threonine protein kinase
MKLITNINDRIRIAGLDPSVKDFLLKQVLIEISEILIVLHEKFYCHRDLKSNNIFVDDCIDPHC